MNAILYLLSKELKARGYNVVGASKDSCASHRKFADKYELPFTLLADPSAEMIQAFGAWGEKVDTKNHAEQILK